MMLNTDQIISISEVNQNFSKAARMVDSMGAVYIFKNNVPKYKLTAVDGDGEIQMTDDEKIDFIAAKVLKKYHAAFEELAK